MLRFFTQFPSPPVPPSETQTGRLGDWETGGKTESGYTLVAVVLGMMILAIAIAVVGPSIGTLMRREREQELIFRGKQYARAISLFQRRYGRFPNELKELYENRPRTIRHLFKDPMCNCADWQGIVMNTPDASIGGTGGPRPIGGVAPVGLQPTAPPGIFGRGPETKTVGPIVGVRSKVHQEALTEWRGQKFYDQWRFITGDADRDTTGLGTGIRPIGAPPFPMVTAGPRR